MSAQAATPSAASAASAAPPLALLCGASGFIGRHIACALRAAGWQVLAKHFAEMNKRGRPGCAAPGTWSTPSFTCKLRVANGTRYPRTTRPAAPANARQGGQAGQAQRGHHRPSIGQDRLKRGGAVMTQAKKSWGTSAYCRRHNETVAGCGSALGRYSRPGWSQNFAGEAVHAL